MLETNTDTYAQIHPGHIKLDETKLIKIFGKSEMRVAASWLIECLQTGTNRWDKISIEELAEVSEIANPLFHVGMQYLELHGWILIYREEGKIGLTRRLILSFLQASPTQEGLLRLAWFASGEVDREVLLPNLPDFGVVAPHAHRLP